VIVVDASAVTELLLQTERGRRVERRLDGDEDLHAPHLLDVEVLSALRRLVQAGEMRLQRTEEAIEDLSSIRLIRHGQLDLATRAWELRQNVTAYDAMYIALAESLDATVVT
jgi:predicted nucleic acid-binding protein